MKTRVQFLEPRALWLAHMLACSHTNTHINNFLRITSGQEVGKVQGDRVKALPAGKTATAKLLSQRVIPWRGLHGGAGAMNSKGRER